MRYLTGDVSVAAIIKEFLDLGYAVSIPFGDDLRYDLIIDNGKNLIRVQCKTARKGRSSIIFPTSSSSVEGKKSYRGEVDLIVAYCSDDGNIYAIPTDVAPLTECRLSTTGKGSRPAQDHLIGRLHELDLIQPSSIR